MDTIQKYPINQQPLTVFQHYFVQKSSLSCTNLSRVQVTLYRFLSESRLPCGVVLNSISAERLMAVCCVLVQDINEGQPDLSRWSVILVKPSRPSFWRSVLCHYSLFTLITACSHLQNDLLHVLQKDKFFHQMPVC